MYNQRKKPKRFAHRKKVELVEDLLVVYGFHGGAVNSIEYY